MNEILLKFPDKNFDRNSFDIWLKNEVLNSLPYYENIFKFLIEFFFSFKMKFLNKEKLKKKNLINPVDCAKKIFKKRDKDY